MNFSYSKNIFNSFYRNMANNKNSMKFLNSNTNSKRSLIFFYNKFHFSNIILLTNILSGKGLSTMMLNKNQCLPAEMKNGENEFLDTLSLEPFNQTKLNILIGLLQFNKCKNNF